jgi:rubrerythrin
MGGTKFAPDEILRLAVKIEANGGDFYRKVLSLYKDKDMKELFNTLAEEEDKHKSFFEEILNSLEDKDYLDVYNDSEYQNYINAMANEVVFTQAAMVKKLEEGFKSIEEVFDFALGLEEDSILFYSELKGSILKDKGYLSVIINEERKHFSMISDLKSKYLKRR